MKILYDDPAARLLFFNELYEHAKTFAEPVYAEMDKYLRQYKGDNEIDGSSTPAKVVRNITYELVESQIAGYIPNPAVTPRIQSDRNERNAKAIETLLKNKRDELPFEKMNDIDERFNPIYGGSVWLAEWDESIKTHSTVGDVRVTVLSPRRFLGQPHIYEIDDMEYCFITFETTKEDLVRRFDVSEDEAAEASSEENNEEETATLCVCYYKNDEGKVCEFAWSDEVVMVDLEDYYQRKRRYCKKCDQKEGVCTCEKPSFFLKNEEFEELDADILLSDGQSVIPARSAVIRDGEVQTEERDMPALLDDGSVAYAMDGESGLSLPIMHKVLVPKTEPTRLPFYTPDRLPVVIRKNTSEEDNLFGQSDCKFIRAQQQEINKIESRISKKVMGSGVYPIVPEKFSMDVDNSIFEKVFRAGPENMGQFGRVDLQVEISRDVAAADRLYDQAKRILGITDSFQGQYDGSAQSGRAKQLQIQQAAGRLDSKRQMKNAAYAELDRIIFQYYLAYADEPRPATFRDAQGRLQNCIFRRHDFIERDEVTGEYYYNDQYMFRTDASIDVEKSRELLWQENRQNLQSGAYGDPARPETRLVFWQNMERTHYPFAQENVDRIKAEIEQMQQMQALQDENAALQDEVNKRAGYEAYLADKLGGR